MLSFSFYPQTGEPIILDVSEIHYEKLAHAGLGRVVQIASYEIVIEEDKYEINAIKLNFDNRRTILNLLETEQHNELEAIFKDVNDVKEIFQFPENIEKMEYVKLLTNLCEKVKDNSYIFFSYE